MDYYDFYDHKDYSSPYMETTLIGIMMIFFIVMLVCVIFALISYILRGIGMYTIAKRQGMDYAWLAFVPFARTYLHGELAGSIRLKHKSIQNPGIWLLALPFLYGAVSSLLNGILWFVGFGSITKAFQYAVLPYGRLELSAGAIMGMVILFVIIAVVSVAYTALYKSFEVLVNHQILERFTSKNMSIVHAVLSTLIPMYESICLFVMRNRPFNPGMEPPTPQPFMQSPPPGTYYGAPVPPPEPPVPPVSSMGGGYYENTAGGVPSVQDTAENVAGAPTVQNAVENAAGAPTIQNTAENENRTQELDSYGNAFSAPDFGNTGSILGNSDFENTTNTFGTPYSENTGSILDTSEEKSEDSVKDETTSSVNFTLPENEHKDI